MADLTPEQEVTRGRVEGLIALAAPFLDVVLGIGERISRIAEPTDHEYYPIRPGPETAELPGREGRDAENPAATSSPGGTDRRPGGGDEGVVDATAEEIPVDGDRS
jgi:hypothetical protein